MAERVTTTVAPCTFSAQEVDAMVHLIIHLLQGRAQAQREAQRLRVQFRTVDPMACKACGYRTCRCQTSPSQTLDLVVEEQRRRLASDIVSGEHDAPEDTLGAAVRWREQHWGKSGL